MLFVLLIATSLAAQAWIFRDTPSHPEDPCERVADHCPEEGLDVLFARQAEVLARHRAKARGEQFPASAASGSDQTARMQHRDSLQAEACRLPESGD